MRVWTSKNPGTARLFRGILATRLVQWLVSVAFTLDSVLRRRFLEADDVLPYRRHFINVLIESKCPHRTGRAHTSTMHPIYSNNSPSGRDRKDCVRVKRGVAHLGGAWSRLSPPPPGLAFALAALSSCRRVQGPPICLRWWMFRCSTPVPNCRAERRLIAAVCCHRFGGDCFVDWMHHRCRFERWNFQRGPWPCNSMTIVFFFFFRDSVLRAEACS